MKIRFFITSDLADPINSWSVWWSDDMKIDSSSHPIKNNLPSSCPCRFDHQSPRKRKRLGWRGGRGEQLWWKKGCNVAESEGRTKMRRKRTKRKRKRNGPSILAGRGKMDRSEPKIGCYCRSDQITGIGKGLGAYCQFQKRMVSYACYSGTPKITVAAWFNGFS